MRYIQALLCALAFSPIYAEYTLEIYYQEGATSPDAESLVRINRYANKLYLCDSIEVTFHVSPELRRTRNFEQILEARQLKIRQLFKEEQMRPVYLNFIVGTSTNQKSGADAVIKGWAEYFLSEERTYIPDTVLIDDRGWRVRCKVPDAALAKQLTVEMLDVYNFLVETNTPALLSNQRQIDISSIYRIRLPDSLQWADRLTVLIPVEKKLIGNHLLLTPCNSGFSYFLNGKSRAKTRTTNKQPFLTIPVQQSTIVAVGEISSSGAPCSFAAPEGFIMKRAEIRSNRPAIYTRARVQANEVLATFAAIPTAENVEFRFTLEDLEGNQITTDWLLLDELRKTNKCKIYKSGNGSEFLLLSDYLLVQPEKLARYE